MDAEEEDAAAAAGGVDMELFGIFSDMASGFDEATGGFFDPAPRPLLPPDESAPAGLGGMALDAPLPSGLMAQRSFEDAPAFEGHGADPLPPLVVRPPVHSLQQQASSTGLPPSLGAGGAAGGAGKKRRASDREGAARARKPYSRAAPKVSAASSSASSFSAAAAPAAPAAHAAATDESGMTEEDRAKARLARKAELARRSRRRKKAFFETMEEQNRAMRAEIDLLKKQLELASSRDERERRKNQMAVRETMAQLVSAPRLDPEQQRTLESSIRQFVANSRERQSKVFHHLDRASECLEPGLQVKFALWGLDQPEEFFSQPGIWQELMHKHVQVTPEQLAKITARKERIHAERVALASCQRMLKETRERVQSHVINLNKEMDQLATVLSPGQLARFYTYVETHKWAMGMFDGMWNEDGDAANRR